MKDMGDKARHSLKIISQGNIAMSVNIALFGIGLDTYWPQFTGTGHVFRAICNQLMSA